MQPEWLLDISRIFCESAAAQQLIPRMVRVLQHSNFGALLTNPADCFAPIAVPQRIVHDNDFNFPLSLRVDSSLPYFGPPDSILALSIRIQLGQELGCITARHQRLARTAVSGREVALPYIDPALRGRCGPVSEMAGPVRAGFHRRRRTSGSKSTRSLSTAFQYAEISLVPFAVSEAVVRVFFPTISFLILMMPASSSLVS